MVAREQPASQRGSRGERWLRKLAAAIAADQRQAAVAAPLQDNAPRERTTIQAPDPESMEIGEDRRLPDQSLIMPAQQRGV